MSDAIAAKRALRTRLMNFIYDMADGSTKRIVEPAALMRTEGLTGIEGRRKVEDAVEYLINEGLLLPHRSLAGLPSVQLTHSGLVEIERARTQPERPTEHFGPINITNVHGPMIGSQILQGSPGAQQSSTLTVDDGQRVRMFIEAARQAASNRDLDPNDRSKVLSDLDFMESELAKPEPRWERLRAMATGVQAIILSGLGGALGDAITSLPWHAALTAFP